MASIWALRVTRPQRTFAPVATMPAMPLRVLLTNHRMAGRGGTQLWIRDVAPALAARGLRPVVWSPQLGECAEEVRALGIPVVDDLAAVAERPDLIHGHHLLETAAALAHFPGVPALFVRHGLLPWQERPPGLSRIRRFLAVDRLRRERLIAEGIDPARIEVLPNFVDPRRLPEPARRGDRPRRALLYSNRSAAPGLLPALEAACRTAGLPGPAVVGVAAGNAIADPGPLLARFDVVFATGRAALEAMATGAAVVLLDAGGSGPLVTGERFDELAELNFGLGALRSPHDAAAIGAALAGYDADEALAVAGRVRERCTLARTVERLVTIYREVLDEPTGASETEEPALPPAEGRALARLLTELSRAGEAGSDPRVGELEAELAALRGTAAFRLREWILRSPLRRALAQSTRRAWSRSPR